VSGSSFKDWDDFAISPEPIGERRRRLIDGDLALYGVSHVRNGRRVDPRDILLEDISEITGLNRTRLDGRE
jgi:hypothetical protein